MLSPERRHCFRQTALAAIAVGVAASVLVLALDQLLFGGVSLQRVKAVGEYSFTQRVLIVVFSAITEELVYRVGIATAAAGVAFLALRGVTPRAVQVSIWIGILVACVLFGLAHVTNLANVPHPYLRAVTLNGVAGLVLGWLYWLRGLEAAVLAHLAADAMIYLLLGSII